jgi:hypothetical protein
VRQRARPISLVTNPIIYREHSKETANAKFEEGVGDGRSVCPESSGLHAAYNAKHNGTTTPKGEVNPLKLSEVWIEG